ncbi:ABC transporter permease subunit [Pseudonocardia sichuanensis]|uniref:Peptide/nickel transport system permease protein n=1 Tax=Pseudonocardia kunmingensis TaxID=630975 RepID=A0A543D9Q5_9PSEU|nr:ABC transporter permease subunit [Pseudonocardia kunmingensis]TQM06069.1 peptide/nickel transport system permease protein [Pseudonocardia kunmingensis]
MTARWIAPAAAAAVALLVVTGGWLAPHTVDTVIGLPWETARPGAPLGTDSLGRDVLSRTLAGGLGIAATAVLAGVATTAVGTALGLLAGWRGGVADRAVRAVADVLLALPALVAALVLAVALPGPVAVVVGSVVVGAPLTAKLVRDGTRRVRAAGFVEAAVARGERTPAVLVREVLPALAGLTAADAGLRFVVALQLASALGVLGFGAQPPAADWALMLREDLPGAVLNPPR